MDQYDVLSHPQGQSLLPYFISSQPRSDPHATPAASSSSASEAQRRRSSFDWTHPIMSNRPYAGGMQSSGPYGKDPLWRSQQMTYLHSLQQHRYRGLSRSDPYGAVRMTPDEQGNPRHFHWYRREYLPSSPLSSSRSAHDYYRRMSYEYPVRVLYESPLPSLQRHSSPAPAAPQPPRKEAMQGAEVAKLQREDLSPLQLPEIDGHLVDQYIPTDMHWLFEPINTKHQPHLDKLRERKRKLEEAWTTGDMSLSEDATLIMPEAKCKRKGSNQGLLSEAEKKANHIASEQKRRANIRKGYDMLCSMVPGLEKNSMESTQKKHLFGDEDTGDQRGSSFSEISILEEVLEHLTQRLKEHHMLLLRKHEAQQRVLSQRRRMLV
ncbi:unnamed protein product [Malassezia sympodialis ATCC 42132]|nr:uncharacterized protein MSY001_3213 [Malassezia sympodialis ATCC 42132]CCV00508.1 unnamed protein product [Malassezia sympodialis ATCC 42132]|eukprot:XP_018741702.1 uncharacterized protein MSY001_3213 [Malassezia sympodialis ATCC 42132]